MNKIIPGAIIILALLLSCSGEKKAGTTGVQKAIGTVEQETSGEEAVPSTAQGRYSLEISPAGADCTATLSLAARGFDLKDARIEWLVNGSPEPDATALTFKAADAKKGDSVCARTTIGDAVALSNTVQIRNALPWISKIKILPEVYRPGDTLSVEVAAGDPDGDEVTLDYAWTKNGEPAGNGSKMDAPIERGDKVSVKITPFDGEIYGEPLVLNTEIRNIPPVFVGDQHCEFKGDVYICMLKATDSDGDALTYSLKGAPPGMTADPETGEIRWNVPQDFAGKAAFKAVVRDGHGGEAEHNLSFTIKKQ